MAKKEKMYSSLIMFGASILLFRTLRLMFFEDGFIILSIWVKVLTFIEMIIDIMCIVFSFRWLTNSLRIDKVLALRFGATATIVHACRVLIYVLASVGPMANFDKKPEYRVSVKSDLFWVYFASILSIGGVIGLVLIGKRIKKLNK